MSNRGPLKIKINLRCRTRFAAMKDPDSGPSSWKFGRNSNKFGRQPNAIICISTDDKCRRQMHCRHMWRFLVPWFFFHFFNDNARRISGRCQTGWQGGSLRDICWLDKSSGPPVLWRLVEYKWAWEVLDMTVFSIYITTTWPIEIESQRNSIAQHRQKPTVSIWVGRTVPLPNQIINYWASVRLLLVRSAI